MTLSRWETAVKTCHEMLRHVTTTIPLRRQVLKLQPQHKIKAWIRRADVVHILKQSFESQCIRFESFRYFSTNHLEALDVEASPYHACSHFQLEWVHVRLKWCVWWCLIRLIIRLHQPWMVALVALVLEKPMQVIGLLLGNLVPIKTVRQTGKFNHSASFGNFNDEILNDVVDVWHFLTSLRIFDVILPKQIELRERYYSVPLSLHARTRTHMYTT